MGDQNDNSAKKAAEDIRDRFAAILGTTSEHLHTYLTNVDAEGSNVVSIRRRKKR